MRINRLAPRFVTARHLCSAAPAPAPAVWKPGRAVAEVNGQQLLISERAREEVLFVAQPPGAKRGDLTGLRIWGSAYELIEWLSANIDASGRRELTCLELGSGTGIVGIAAAYLGMQVTLTDPGRPVNYTDQHSGSTMDCLQRNMELNHKVSDRMKIRELLWGCEEHIRNIAGELDEPVDLVIGSDLLYQHTNYEPLLATLKAFVTSPGTLVVLCWKSRHGGEDRFLKQVAEDFVVDEKLKGSYRLATLRLRGAPTDKSLE